MPATTDKISSKDAVLCCAVLNPNFTSAAITRAFTPALTADLTEAIRLNPDLAKAHYSRGLAFKAVGLYKAALSDFQKSRDLGDGVHPAVVDLTIEDLKQHYLR